MSIPSGIRGLICRLGLLLIARAFAAPGDAFPADVEGERALRRRRIREEAIVHARREREELRLKLAAHEVLREVEAIRGLRLARPLEVIRLDEEGVR